MKRWLVLILCVLALGIPQRVGHTQGQLDTVRRKVEAYFRTQYGRDYVLIRYTYAYQTWPDTSLGCPQPGMSYQQMLMEGYVWTLEINDNKTYELHSTLDGGQIVLCTPIDRAQLVHYRTYQNGVYVIDYPESWQISANPDAAQVIISPGGAENCGEAGTKILFQQPVGNANTMLDDAMRNAGLVQNVGARTPVQTNPTALSLLYEAPCGSNILQYRATAFPQEAGASGHLILQWASLADFPGWLPVYVRMTDSFRLVGAAAEATGVLASGLEPERLLAGYPLAHLFAQDIFIGEYGDLPGQAITIGSSRPRRGLKFSADGQYLAYIDLDVRSNTERLDVVSRTFPRTPISSNLVANFEAAWSPTGATLAYLEPVSEVGVDGVRLLEVRTVMPTDARNPQILGTIPYVDNCLPQTTVYVPERLYWVESGAGGNRFTFAWLPDNRFLYTTHCNGEGLALWNPADGSRVAIGDDLRRVALSQDATKLAAIGENGVVFIVELATGNRIPLPLEFPADQLAWSNDAQKLYYSNVFVGQPLVVNDPALESRATETLGVFPYTSQLNTVSLLEYDLTTGATHTLWQGQAYAIGRIVMAPNNAGFIFSVIPSDRDFVMTFIQGGDSVALRFAVPETRLYWVTAATAEVRLLAVSSQPAFAPVVPGN